MNPIFAEACCS